jgi:hypothetical protein
VKQFLVVLFVVMMCHLAAAQSGTPAKVTPVQTNPKNFIVGVPGLETATITIPGSSGHRVYLYSVLAVCNAPGTNIVPTIIITDGATTVFSITAETISNETPPIRPLSWNPGLTMSLGGTVVIKENYGAACGGGTTLIVQADQF